MESDKPSDFEVVWKASKRQRKLPRHRFNNDLELGSRLDDACFDFTVFLVKNDLEPKEILEIVLKNLHHPIAIERPRCRRANENKAKSFVEAIQHDENVPPTVEF